MVSVAKIILFVPTRAEFTKAIARSMSTSFFECFSMYFRIPRDSILHEIKYRKKHKSKDSMGANMRAVMEVDFIRAEKRTERAANGVIVARITTIFTKTLLKPSRTRKFNFSEIVDFGRTFRAMMKIVKIRTKNKSGATERTINSIENRDKDAKRKSPDANIVNKNMPPYNKKTKENSIGANRIGLILFE
ncbi:hypothetical protein [Candidatus Hydrogenosomobacter endosymbioticus]|nr:hypothetical protein [Candidatus Hydrogenosomobacter endosymbioticus]